MEEYRVALKTIVDEFSLEGIFVPENIDEIYVVRSDVSRPGLPLCGFFEYFEGRRIQMMGKMELSYLEGLTTEARAKSLSDLLSRKPVCVIITTGLDIPEEMVGFFSKYDVPLYRTSWNTSDFMAALIASLNIHLAERISLHAVLVEVYGEGVLLLGDSGMGKSETAIELLKRGHRLIADDSVDIKKVSSKTLVGSAPELIRHYVEMRGIGIIDVRRIFGMGSVKMSEKIDLVINIENWVDGKMYERFGLEQEYTEILGLKIPSITVPVTPGRNLAVIIEIAAMNNRQKKMGYNTAEEFNKKLMSMYGE
ncbi:MAG: HPr(Ser) kinase/phosphatase [Clostridia bacterium]|nr:HPr(Ser) kinase/phosphatase [Clostridia bacterium]MBQ7048239.1 HPr(Ser) kinase/phosphatase [Clostridia bacterium]